MPIWRVNAYIDPADTRVVLVSALTTASDGVLKSGAVLPFIVVV